MPGAENLPTNRKLKLTREQILQAQEQALRAGELVIGQILAGKDPKKVIEIRDLFWELVDEKTEQHNKLQTEHP